MTGNKHIIPDVTNSQWLLAARPQGLPRRTDFEWRESELAPLADGQARVRLVYLSLDPTNRVWMEDRDSYLPALKLGELMRGVALGVVEESKAQGLEAGDLVQGLMGWQRYYVSNGRDVVKLPKLPIPLDGYFGLLAHIGFTAYFGLTDIGQPKAGETLVVSAAAGAVGSLVGQMGKILGCRVVGIAGGKAKCDWIVNELGFDAAVDYKNENVYSGLRRACPNGIDIYFENVGGEILEAVLAQINLGARIPLCGLISSYTATTPQPGPRNLGMLLMKRGLMKGFIVTDYAARFTEAGAQIVGWYLAGKLKYRTDIVNGLDQAPEALGKLFNGTNQGKLLVKVSDPPTD